MIIDRRANMLAAAAFASSMVMCIAGALAQAPSELEALRTQAERLFDQGKYAEALATQRTVTTVSEKSETAEVGAPARRTADALVSVAWYALFARAPEEALKASERAHILTPDSLPAETNRAHALLLLGRTREAVDLYLLHKGKRLSADSDKTWEDTIAEDFDALRAAGLVINASPNIVAQLGIAFPELTAEISVQRGKVKQLYSDGKYREAATAAETLITLTRKRYGEHRSEFADALSDLALSKAQLDLKSDAEALHNRSLAIFEKALGSDHPEVGTSLSNLAQLYRKQSRPAEAEPLVKRSLAIFEKALGPDHLVVASTLRNLAGLCQDQGRLPEAEALYKRSLAIREKALGPDHRDVGISLTSLAELYRAQGRNAEAEPLFSRSLAIRQKTDPVKCVLINYANFHLRCANFYAPMVNQQKRIYSTSKAAKDKTRLDATLKVQLEHINIGSDFYSKAGRKFEMKEMLARSKIDRPDLETAYEGVDQFVQQDINTRPTKSKFLDLCAADLIAKGLTEKRSLELVDEALALLKDGKSCIK